MSALEKASEIFGEAPGGTEGENTEPQQSRYEFGHSVLEHLAREIDEIFTEPQLGNVPTPIQYDTKLKNGLVMPDKRTENDSNSG